MIATLEIRKWADAIGRLEDAMRDLGMAYPPRIELHPSDYELLERRIWPETPYPAETPLARGTVIVSGTVQIVKRKD